MIVYLNGAYIDDADARIPLFDGGYLYGDGVFETLRLYGGRPFDLHGHLDRMNAQLERLEYRWRASPAKLRPIIAELASANGLSEADGRCRITISRGSRPGSPLPLLDHADIRPTVSVFLQALDPALERDQRDGLRLKVMHSEFARGNFPDLKTLNYLTTIMAMRTARAAGCAEALLVDDRGRVLEGATSNVFMINGNRLDTPPLELGLLAGRTRALLLEIAADSGLDCRETPFTVDDLAEADEVFICGSVKEVTPVVGLGDRPIAGGRPGRRTRQLHEEYRRRALLDVAGGENRG